MLQTTNKSVPLPFFLAGAFLIVAPLSLATDLEAAPTLKYVRVAICMTGAFVAVLGGAAGQLRLAAGALMAFAVFYSLAPIWSQYPLQGVLYKTVFLSALILGMCVGVSWRSREELKNGLRLLASLAAVASLIVLYQYRGSPEAMTRLGRLAAFGINANAIGMTASGYLLITIFLAMNERGIWRIVGSLGSGILVILLIATGSRGGLAMAVLGASIQFIPWMKRPGRLVGIGAILAVILLAFSGDIDPTAVDRLTSDVNTRSGMWQAGLRLFFQSPVVGHGWISSGGRSTSNLQNLYLQILAETGIVGGVLFLLGAFGMAGLIRRLSGRIYPVDRPVYYFALGLMVALVVHGMAESALILGSTVNTMLFGFALGLFQNLFSQTMFLHGRQPESRLHRVSLIGMPNR